LKISEMGKNKSKGFSEIKNMPILTFPKLES
jgi:hypothetical protein